MLGPPGSRGFRMSLPDESLPDESLPDESLPDQRPRIRDPAEGVTNRGAPRARGVVGRDLTALGLRRTLRLSLTERRLAMKKGAVVLTVSLALVAGLVSVPTAASAERFHGEP